MKNTIVLLLALLMCGFGVETPESKAEQERIIREWHATTNRRFDTVALRGFLIELTLRLKVAEGVDLSKAKITDTWTSGGCALFCGDWTFTCPHPSTDVFSFDYEYEEEKFISLERIRKDRDRFEFTKASKGELVELLAVRKNRQPNQALQTTSVTRSVFGKVPEFDRYQRGV